MTPITVFGTAAENCSRTARGLPSASSIHPAARPWPFRCPVVEAWRAAHPVRASRILASRPRSATLRWPQFSGASSCDSVRARRWRAWCGSPAGHPPESPLEADPRGGLAACRRVRLDPPQPWVRPTAMDAPHSRWREPGPGSLAQPTASAWLTSRCSTSSRSSAALRRARSKSPWASGSMRSAMRSSSSSRRSLSTASNSSSIR